MSFQREFLDELRSRISLTQLVGRKVVWNAQKSNTQEGDMWASCPFHEEQSASFHVDDGKGYYYCFGCKAKGDIFSFVRETEGVGFVQAVEFLAREAGLPVPNADHSREQTLDHITCECSCGRVSKVSARTLEPLLGGTLTSANALLLIPKLRCVECHSPANRIYDGNMKQLFGPPQTEQKT